MSIIHPSPLPTHITLPTHHHNSYKNITIKADTPSLTLVAT